MSKPWQGNFEAATDEETVLKQIKHNSEHWGSVMCKTSTMLKYCKEKCVLDPETVLARLIKDKLVTEPKTGYVGLSLLGKLVLEQGGESI